MVVHLKAPFPMNRELDLSAISGKEKQILHFMVLFSSSCTSQGKSRSHDIWYFRSRLLFPAKTSGWDSAFLLSPSSFVKFNWCVAWMSSLLETSRQNQNELNSWLLIKSSYLFVWLVHVRGLSTNLPMNTCSWRKTCSGNSDFAAAVGFYSCPSASSVILNHLPKWATCAACTLAKHIILLALGKWASVSVEHCLGSERVKCYWSKPSFILNGTKVQSRPRVHTWSANSISQCMFYWATSQE